MKLPYVVSKIDIATRRRAACRIRLRSSELAIHLLAEYRTARRAAQVSVAVVMAVSVVLLYLSWWSPQYPVEPLSVGYWIGAAGRGLGGLGIVIGLVMASRLK